MRGKTHAAAAGKIDKTYHRYIPPGEVIFIDVFSKVYGCHPYSINHITEITEEANKIWGGKRTEKEITSLIRHLWDQRLTIADFLD